jgi:DNA-binding NarL/FixJ family response regulator
VSVRLLSGDLLFGSKVEGMIREAGFEPVGAAGSDTDAQLVIVDLTDSSTDPAVALSTARGDSEVPALAYYAHTDDDIRRAAIEAGFDLVVPRSRMMREGVVLIRRLVLP